MSARRVIALFRRVTLEIIRDRPSLALLLIAPHILPPLLLIGGVILLATRKVRPGRWFFWVGLLAGLAVMLRQNHFGTFAAVAMASRSPAVQPGKWSSHFSGGIHPG